MSFYETENVYLKAGYLRNPFTLVLEPQFIKDYLYQREANRALNELQQKNLLVLRMPDDSTLSDFTDFYSFFARSMLFAPDSSYFNFEVSGSALINQGLLGAFTSIRNRISTQNAERIFLSYFVQKIKDLYEQGTLGANLKLFDPEELYRETIESRGSNLLEIMNYQPEAVKKREDETEEEFSKRKQEIEQKLARRDELRELFYRLIEGENFGPAVVNALRAVIQRGLNEGPDNLIPRNIRLDLLGILKFLRFSHSNIVATFFNLGNIPFLDDEEIAAYESTIAEAETLFRKQSKVVHLTKVSDYQMIGEFFEGKPVLALSFDASFLEIDKEAAGLESEQQFVSLVFYLLGAFGGVDAEAAKAYEEAARQAYSLAEGDTRLALKLLEKAFDRAVESGNLGQIAGFVEAK